MPHLSGTQCPPHGHHDVYRYARPFLLQTLCWSLYFLPTRAHTYMHTTHAHTYTHVNSGVLPPAIWIILSSSSISCFPGPSRLTLISCWSEPQWQPHATSPFNFLLMFGLHAVLCCFYVSTDIVNSLTAPSARSFPQIFHSVHQNGHFGNELRGSWMGWVFGLGLVGCTCIYMVFSHFPVKFTYC